MSQGDLGAASGIDRDDEGKVDVGVREAKDLILRKKVDVLFSGRVVILS
jgi:hypothetical protein